MPTIENDVPGLSMTSKARWSRSRLNRIGILIMLGCLTFSALSVLSFVVGIFWGQSLSAQLDAKYKELYEQGIPVTWDELDAWYPAIPNEENAAILYSEAFTLLDEIDPDNKRATLLHEVASEFTSIDDYPPELIADLRIFLSEIKPVFPIIELASKRVTCKFPVEMSQGYDVELPHLEQLRNVARLMYLSSELSLIDGDADNAARHHIAVVAAGTSLAGEPILISQLVGHRIGKIAFDSLKRMFDDGDFHADSLEDLGRAYSSVYHPDVLAQTMIGERCLATDLTRRSFDESLDKDPEYLLVPDVLERLSDFPVRLYSRYEQLQFFNAFEPIAPGLQPDWPEIATLYRERINLTYPRTKLVSLVMPAVNRSLIAFVRNVAHLRLARTAIAIERYRLAHGSSPESLADLVPTYLDTIPEDPYDGEPLRYRREAIGYTVYSIHDDGFDDNGTPWEKDEDNKRLGDLVFAVTR